MKNYLLLTACILFLASCQEDNETIYSVDHNLKPYVSTFYDEAAERGVTIPQNLIAELKGGQAISGVDTRHEQNYLYFDPATFATYYNENREPQIEAHVYYRLGQLFLKKDISEGESFMNPDFMFEPYNPASKEAMFDALFAKSTTN